MASHKAGRMAEDIKRVVSGMMRELKDPRLHGGSMLTVVRCDVANDGSFCKVYVSSFEGFESAKCPKFEIYTDKKGETRFRLKASNGQVIAASEGYTTKAACKNGIESVRKNSADAPIEEIKD